MLLNVLTTYYRKNGASVNSSLQAQDKERKNQPDDTSFNLCHPAEKIFLFDPASTYHIELINIFFSLHFLSDHTVQ